MSSIDAIATAFPAADGRQGFSRQPYGLPRCLAEQIHVQAPLTQPSKGAIEVGRRRNRMSVPVLNDLAEHGRATPLAANADGGRSPFLLGRDIHDVDRAAFGDDARACRLSKRGVGRTGRKLQRGDANQADFHVDHLCLGHDHDGRPERNYRPMARWHKVYGRARRSKKGVS